MQKKAMLKGIALGILIGVLLAFGGVYYYFASGSAPVATNAPLMPFERTFAREALHAYLDRLPHPSPAVAADGKNFLEGAKLFRENCRMCHGLPGEPRTAIAEGMFPHPPQLFHGKGVTDDEAWETYWKIYDGIRMSGMPAFRDHLTETQIWQLAVLLKHADRISPAVKAELAGTVPATSPAATAQSPR